MDDVTITISGLSELQHALEKMAQEDAKAIVKDALKEGGAELQQAMVDGSTHVPGEPGRIMRTLQTWSKRISMDRGDELAGTVRVGAKQNIKLEKAHMGQGRHKVGGGWGGQPKGHQYHRSLAYIIRLLEFGGADPAENLGRSHPMTAGFETHKNKVLERVISVIREKLGRKLS